jgi:hypothetical protein
MKTKTLKKITKTIVILILVNIIALNYFSFFIKKNIYTLIKSELSSTSSGKSYFGRLNLWRVLAQSGDWETASTLESGIDPTDIYQYKLANQPQELQKSVDLLLKKENKNPDDWMEISKIQSMLGKIEESKEAIKKAYQLDPIRDDISKLYYSTNK